MTATAQRALFAVKGAYLLYFYTMTWPCAYAGLYKHNTIVVIILNFDYSNQSGYCICGMQGLYILPHPKTYYER